MKTGTELSVVGSKRAPGTEVGAQSLPFSTGPWGVVSRALPVHRKLDTSGWHSTSSAPTRTHAACANKLGACARRGRPFAQSTEELSLLVSDGSLFSACVMG